MFTSLETLFLPSFVTIHLYLYIYTNKIVSIHLYVLLITNAYCMHMYKYPRLRLIYI